MKTATIGRIVHYRPTESDRNLYGCNNAVVLPAVVTAVFEGSGSGLVNLKVLNDGERDFWRTSIKSGTDAGTWSWPELVA